MALEFSTNPLNKFHEFLRLEAPSGIILAIAAAQGRDSGSDEAEKQAGHGN